MKLVGLMLCRNEAWCLRASIQSALKWCDELVILNHASTDDSADIVDQLGRDHGRIHLLEETDAVWHEMRHRQRTLDAARAVGATHCAIIDADEFLTMNLHQEIRERIASLPAGQVIQPPWIICWRSLDQYRDDDSRWSQAFVSFAFADEPSLCWRQREQGYDHHHRDPFNSSCVKPWADKSAGGILHIQHANWRRLLAKQAWYKCVETIRWPHFTPEEIESRYNPTVNEQGIGLMAIPSEWWGPERGLIDLKAVPWQEADVHRMISDHGRDKFSALNLFGVA